MNDLLTNMTDKNKLIDMLKKRQTGKTRMIDEEEMNIALKLWFQTNEQIIFDLKFNIIN